MDGRTRRGVLGLVAGAVMSLAPIRALARLKLEGEGCGRGGDCESGWCCQGICRSAPRRRFGREINGNCFVCRRDNPRICTRVA